MNMRSTLIFTLVSTIVIYFIPAAVAAPSPIFNRSSGAHTLNARGIFDIFESVNFFPTLTINKLAKQGREADPSLWKDVITIAKSKPSSALGKSQKEQAHQLLLQHKASAINSIASARPGVPADQEKWTRLVTKYFAGADDADAKEVLAVRKLHRPYDPKSPPSEADVLLVEQARIRDESEEKAGRGAKTTAKVALEHWAIVKSSMEGSAFVPAGSDDVLNSAKMTGSPEIQRIQRFHVQQALTGFRR